MRGRPFLAAFALHFLYGSFEHGGVKLESDGLDVAALLAAEHVARAAQFQVERGDLEAGAEVAEFLERREPAARNVGEFILRRDQQIGVGAAIGAAHAAAQLIELAQAMAVGAIDEDGVGEGNVEAVLDDRGRHQHIVFVAHEGQHHALQFCFAHLTVAYGHARRGHQFLNARGDLVDGLDAIMDEINLAAALQLHFDRGAHDLFVELGDDGLNGHAVFGRRLDDAHVAQADQRHVQRARNGRGAHSQHVDLLAHLLQPLLVAHAEALLFIDDEQAEILKLDVFGKQPMGADEDVDLACLHALDDDLSALSACGSARSSRC